MSLRSSCVGSVTRSSLRDEALQQRGQLCDVLGGVELEERTRGEGVLLHARPPADVDGRMYVAIGVGLDAHRYPVGAARVHEVRERQDSLVEDAAALEGEHSR